MKQATKQDRQKVVYIITTSFFTNPSLEFLIRNQRDKVFYISKIAEYVFDFAIRRNGVYLSENEQGVAICYNYKLSKKDLIDLLLLIKLVILGLSIKRLFKIIRHNNYIASIRPKHGNFYYFWLLGVIPTECPKQSARDLSSCLFRIADENRSEIYAETTVENNKRLYEYFGFEIYKQWYNQESKLDVWFMRKPCLKLN